MRQITSTELFALAARAEGDVKTARRFLDPEGRKRMKPAVRARFERAAAALGLGASADS